MLYLRGKHSFKFGGQYQRTYDKVKTDDTGSLFVANFSNNQTANFNSNSSTLNANTGNSYASFLLGALNTATVLEDTVSGSTPTYASQPAQASLQHCSVCPLSSRIVSSKSRRTPFGRWELTVRADSDDARHPRAAQFVWRLEGE